MASEPILLHTVALKIRYIEIRTKCAEKKKKFERFKGGASLSLSIDLKKVIIMTKADLTLSIFRSQERRKVRGEKEGDYEMFDYVLHYITDYLWRSRYNLYYKVHNLHLSFIF